MVQCPHAGFVMGRLLYVRRNGGVRDGNVTGEAIRTAPLHGADRVAVGTGV